MPDWYSELKSWQQGVGSFLGLLALMTAVWFKFYLDGRRDIALRTEEVRSILSSLYGEIIILRDKLARIANIITKIRMHGDDDRINDGFVKDYLPPKPTVYPALVKEFGFLPANYLMPITKFYANYEEARESLPLISDDRKESYSYLAFLEPAHSAIREIESTLRGIEIEMGFEKINQPDIGLVSDLIDMEREKFREN